MSLCVWLIGLLSTFQTAPPERTQREIIAALIEALDDEDIEVRINLANALARIGEKTTQPLIDALKHPNKERRAGAAYALAQLRPAPQDAVPALLAALKDKEEIVRRQASYALSRIVGPDSPSKSADKNEATRPSVPPPKLDAPPESDRPNRNNRGD
jgi:hypothetical protein